MQFSAIRIYETAYPAMQKTFFLPDE